jgi:hypothetical protein
MYKAKKKKKKRLAQAKDFNVARNVGNFPRVVFSGWVCRHQVVKLAQASVGIGDKRQMGMGGTGGPNNVQR